MNSFILQGAGFVFCTLALVTNQDAATQTGIICIACGFVCHEIEKLRQAIDRQHDYREDA